MRKARLGDVADVNWGDTSVTKASYVDEGFPAFSATGLDGSLPYFDFDRDGIVLSAIGARCGKTWFATGKWSVIKNTIRLWSETPDLDNRYLFWLTADPDFWPKRGAAQPFITIGDARRLEVSFPPLDEQKRIAAILDQADALRQLRIRSVERAKILPQSIFREMFGNWSSPGYTGKLVSCGKILDFLTSGSRGWAPYYATSGSLFFRIQNVRADYLDLDDVAYVHAPSTAEARRTLVKPGDVLMSITADLGRTAVVPSGLGDAYINQHLAILRSSYFEPRFLSAALSSPAGQRSIQGRNKTGVKAGLNFEDIKSLQVPDVSMHDQKKFVERVRQVDHIRKHHELHLANAEELFRSLQRRAFRGDRTAIRAETELNSEEWLHAAE